MIYSITILNYHPSYIISPHTGESQAYCLLYGHTKPKSEIACRQIVLWGAILDSHSWQITDCFKEGHTEQDRKPQRKSNAFTEQGFCAEASHVQKIVICLLVPKMHIADSRRDFSNCVSRVHLIMGEYWLDQSLANQLSLVEIKSPRDEGDWIIGDRSQKVRCSQKGTLWGETGERIVRQSEEEVGT